MKKIVYLILSLFGAYVSEAQCPVTLNYDTGFCSTSTFSITIDASVLDTSLCSDSVTIVLNAANTVLAGDTGIYMLSAPQFTPFVAWGTNPYTTGSTTLNNGVGEMTSLGNNLWAITIHPQSYYNYPADTCLNGIWMVFRNTNFQYLNSDDASRNFFVLTNTTGNAVSEIDPDTVSAYKSVGHVAYKWNDGNTANPRTFTTGGNYTVTATSVGGCTASGSVSIKAGAHAPVSLGSSTIRCNPDSSVTLNAGTGFVRYLWLNDTAYNGSTYAAKNAGLYWITATDSAGCTSNSTIQIANTEVNNLSIPDSLNTCPGKTITVDASVNVDLNGDSVVIIYNATKGVTGLIDSPKVYMHSGPIFTPSQGWQGPYTVGNYGKDDGIGEMTSLGNNLWRIAIDPYAYYKINPDTVFTGMAMIFRNASGTATGKNDVDTNIYVRIINNQFVSNFEGVTASRTPRLPLTYNWSNSVTGPVDNFTTADTYTVTLSDNNSCSRSASVEVTFNNLPAINLGPSDTICTGGSVTLTAPAGFASYAWSNNATSSSITVSTGADYSVTATDTAGCTAVGSRQITLDTSSANLPVPSITAADSVYCGTAFTLQADTGFVSYVWNTGASTPTIYVSDSGTYTLTVTNSLGCSGSQSIYIDTCGGGGPIVVGCGSPTADFVVLSISPDNTVYFSDSSLITKVMYYYWTYGDGTSDSTIGSNEHTYAQSGSYWVTLAVADSCGGYSVDSMLVDVNVTGVIAVSGLSSLNVYPNPSSGVFTVDILLDEQHPLNIILYNALGNIVWQKAEILPSGRHVEDIDASYLSSGIYLLELRTDTGQTINKITITR